MFDITLIESGKDGIRILLYLTDPLNITDELRKWVMGSDGKKCEISAFVPSGYLGSAPEVQQPRFRLQFSISSFQEL